MMKRKTRRNIAKVLVVFIVAVFILTAFLIFRI